MSPGRRRHVERARRTRARRLSALGAVGLVAGAAAALGVGLAASGRDSGAGASADQALAAARALPPPRTPAFSPGRPRLLDRSERTSRWAAVIHATVARAGPSDDAAGVIPLETRTPEGTANLVVVAETSAGGEQWVRARLPVLPNGTLGWVPRRALGGYHFVHTHLIVDRERLSATLLHDGRPVFRARVGVGKTYWPTPAGEFYIRDKLTRYSSPFYGPVAFGTSARSAVLTDWPNGGFIGIHGTNEPQLIPGRVSHGCIRMRNADIERLSRLMPVGTPLTIR